MNTPIKYILADARPVVFENDFDTANRAFVPEVWAQESLMVLEENMVAGNLVHRDFEDEIKEFGDVVNTRKPGKFEAKRKGDYDDVIVQDASAEKVQVKLNQHLHTSFTIKDGEMTKSFKDLATEYLTPAVQSIASAVDQIVLNQVHQFSANSVGKLGTAAGKSTIIAANTLMNQNLVPGGSGMRNFILTPQAEGDLLDVSDFTKVNESGDGGEALQNAMLGRKFGYDFYMAQNTPSIAATQTTQGALVNLVAGYAAGTTTMAINGTSDAFLPGQWFTVAGDMIPQMITAATGTPTTSITFYPGLKTGVANDAVITVYPYGAVDQAVVPTGYADEWVKSIAVDGFSDAPLKGQMLTHGITSAYETYGLINTPTTTSLDLDRETQSAWANNDQLALGPAGDYSFAFHRNAVALVTRPLVIVPDGFGARQASVSYNGLSMRVSMSYEGRGQGLLVTVDTLCGVKVLDPALGLVMYS